MESAVAPVSATVALASAPRLLSDRWRTLLIVATLLTPLGYGYPIDCRKAFGPDAGRPIDDWDICVAMPPGLRRTMGTVSAPPLPTAPAPTPVMMWANLDTVRRIHDIEEELEVSCLPQSPPLLSERSGQVQRLLVLDRPGVPLAAGAHRGGR